MALTGSHPVDVADLRSRLDGGMRMRRWAFWRVVRWPSPARLWLYWFMRRWTKGVADGITREEIRRRGGTCMEGPAPAARETMSRPSTPR